VLSADSIAITFPSPIAALNRQFDQVAILSAHSPRKEMAVLGPFMVAEHKAGAYVLLQRNPNYWKHDEQGKRLPYLDSVRSISSRIATSSCCAFGAGNST